MSRIWPLLLMFITGCATQLVPATVTLDGYSKVLVVINPNRKAASLERLEGLYRYVNVVPSLSQYAQQRLCQGFAESQAKLILEAEQEGLTVPKGSTATEFQPAFLDTLKVCNELVVGPDRELDRKVARRLARRLKVDALLVGRVFVFADDWAELSRRLRTGLSLTTYRLNFGVALEYSLYDLKDGSLLQSRADRQSYLYKSKRRQPPDPAAIGASDDPYIGNRVLSILNQLVERAVQDYSPTID
jgi:hypothetical protein